jgi:hypothetical protein
MSIRNWKKQLFSNSYFVIGLLIFTTLLLNHNLFSKILSVNPAYIESSDGNITEFIYEESYQKIREGKSPFQRSDLLIYPFGANYSMNDPGISSLVYYYPLRSLFSIQTSTLIVQMVHIVLASVLMYLLLKKMKIGDQVSFLLALSFSLTPFISHRLIGHYTYTCIYIFPALMLMIKSFIDSSKVSTKVTLSLVFGMFLAFTVLANFYYFVEVLLGVMFITFWYLITNFKKTTQYLINNSAYFLTASILCIIVLLPWFDGIYEHYIFDGRSKLNSLGSAIHFSADLVDWIIPSSYNVIYHSIFSKISQYSSLANKLFYHYTHNWERFAYPGLIILLVHAFVVFNYRRLKQIDIWKKISPYLWASYFSALLVLGPFLKLMGKWSLNLDGVAVVFPLPFLILHYVPGLESLRVPTRMLPMFIFFSIIVSAQVLQYIITIKPKYKTTILSILFVVLAVDQQYTLPKYFIQPINQNIYNLVAEDKTKSRVLEIPYSVRDGFEYIGFVHSLTALQGSLIHHHPVMGGYLARVSPEVFAYYKNLPFLGYVAQITDKGNYNPLYELPEEPIVTEFSQDTTKVIDELNFFGIEHVILEKNEEYSDVLKDLLSNVGAKLEYEDDRQKYYSYEVENLDQFSQVNFSSTVPSYHIGRGLVKSEDSYLMSDSKSIVYLKPSTNTQTMLIVKAAAKTDSKVNIYVDKKLVSILSINQTPAKHYIQLPKVNPKEILQVFFQIVDQVDPDPRIELYEVALEEV